MDLRGDDRGQALQIGAVLLLGILVVMMTLYQATVVPQQNERAELDSYLEASADMASLRNDVLATSARGGQSGTNIQTGTHYQSRVMFVNPAPPTGTLRTSSEREVTFSNVSAVASAANGTQEIWNGSNRTYDTKAVTFAPDYNEYNAQPITYSGVSLYRQTDQGPIPMASQTLVQSNRITLVTIAGNVSTAQLVTTVTTEPVSVATRTVAITGENSTNFSITLTTGIPAAEWNRTVGARIERNPNVVRVSPSGPNAATIVFNGSRRYELRLARVEVHTESDTGGITGTSPAYVVHAEGDDASIRKKQTVELVAEVRDRYNNPKAGVNVKFNTSHGTFVMENTSPGERTVPTDSNGRAAVRFTPNQTGTLQVRAYVDVNDDGAYTLPQERTNFTVYVSPGRGPP